MTPTKQTKYPQRFQTREAVTHTPFVAMPRIQFIGKQYLGYVELIQQAEHQFNQATIFQVDENIGVTDVSVHDSLPAASFYPHASCGA